MCASNKRCIPIPTVSGLIVTALRLDRCLFTSLLIKSYQPTVLRLGINGIWIIRIRGTFKTVTAIGHEPITVDDPACVDRLRRPSKAVVILSSSVNIVERPIVVDGHAVKL